LYKVEKEEKRRKKKKKEQKEMSLSLMCIDDIAIMYKHTRHVKATVPRTLCYVDDKSDKDNDVLVKSI
jgi:hypothetical protein